MYGEALEAELERVAEKAKTAKAAQGAQKLVLEKWLSVGDKQQIAGFRTPVATK